MRRERKSRFSSLEWDIKLAVILLVPAFPAMPAFVVGKNLAISHPGLKRLGRLPLWLITCLLSLGWLFTLVLAAGGRHTPPWLQHLWDILPPFLKNMLAAARPGPQGSLLLLLFIIMPFVLSGLPAGILFEKRTRHKWLAVLPLTLTGLVLISPILFIMIVGIPC